MNYQRVSTDLVTLLPRCGHTSTHVPRAARYHLRITTKTTVYATQTEKQEWMSFSTKEFHRPEVLLATADFRVYCGQRDKHSRDYTIIRDNKVTLHLLSIIYQFHYRLQRQNILYYIPYTNSWLYALCLVF